MHLPQRGGKSRVRNGRQLASKNEYRLLEGKTLDLTKLDPDERDLVRRLQRKANTLNDWNRLGNYWMAEVSKHFAKKGLSRRDVSKTAAFAIGQDLEQRLGIAAGLVQPPDYRAELVDLIRDEFPSQKHFCEATGVSESLLSHVLSKRKHLAVDKLEAALDRIGYRLKFVRKRTR